MRAKILVSLALILATTLGAAETKKTAAASFDVERLRIPYKKFVLDNGLTLLVHEDHSVPIVAVNSWYHVGSRNEKRGKTGFAHLFEHFFFNGSENYPHGFREAMDDLGANNRNGTTNEDRTNFFEDVPVSALERTLFLEADRMGFLEKQISKEMLERERGVVQNEKRQGENAPYGRVFEKISETIYPYSHPYSWSVIGSMDDLNAASLEDVKEWYRTYYGPNNAVLALAGDITPERALELVNKYFGSIPPGPPLRRVDAWVPKFDRNMRDEMEDRVPQARIYRVYHAPAWADADSANLELFAQVLSGSKSSPLDRALIYDKKVATGVNAAAFESEIASLFVVTVTVKPGVDVAEAEKETDAVMDALLRRGPSADELERARARIISSFTRGIERLGGFGGRSDVLAESATYAGDPEFYIKRLKSQTKATPAQVQATAKKWLDANHYTMVVRPMAKLAPAKVALDRKVLPSLGGASDVSFPQIQRTTLSNGMKVMLLERHATPIVNLALVLDAGYSSDSLAKAGLASLSLDLMPQGTATRDAFKIADDLDRLGARITTTSGIDLSYVRLQALPMNLKPSLDILADVVLNPAFPQDMIEISKRQRLARISQEKVEAGSMAFRVLPKLLYGENHVYAKPFTGTGFTETVQPLTRDDFAAWHRTWFHPNNTTVVVTGDVTMKDIVPQLESAFASWKRGEAPKKEIATLPATKGGRVYLIDKPDAPQSVIIAAHLSERGGSADDLAIETVLRNFGGIATSRLNRNLRLDKHWSYGTQGGLTDLRGQRPFNVIAPVQTDKTKESIQEVIKEIRGLAGERVMEGEEYASTMRNATMRLPGRFETLGSLEAAAINIINYGYPDDYYTKYAASVRGLTESNLNAAAKKAVRPEEVVWIIVGDLKKIEAGVRELNLGEVVRIEAP